MKLAFVGTGNVGGALARALGKQSHTILLAARDPAAAEVNALAKSIGALASVATAADAIARADIVILATPWNATVGLVREHATALAGKILIDCTNPLKADLSGLTVGHTTSGAEEVQAAAPQARVFKAFNSTGFNIMEHPELEGRRATMFFCGDDKTERHLVHQLVSEVGFDAIDAGSLSSARLLEPYALLWIMSAYKFGLGRDFAFNLIRRNA